MIVLSKIFLFHLIFTLTHRQVPGTKRKHPTNQMINRVFAVRTGLYLLSNSFQYLQLITIYQYFMKFIFL